MIENDDSSSGRFDEVNNISEHDDDQVDGTSNESTPKNVSEDWLKLSDIEVGNEEDRTDESNNIILNSTDASETTSKYDDDDVSSHDITDEHGCDKHVPNNNVDVDSNKPQTEDASDETTPPTASRVVARVRPTLEGDPELSKRFSYDIKNSVSFDDTTFSYDAVLGGTTSQEQLFNGQIKSQVKRLGQNINTCTFVYGQTGSGKTHTMFGTNSFAEGKLDDEAGIASRFLQELLEICRMIEEKENKKTMITMSAIEIYGVKLTDLMKNRKIDAAEDAVKIKLKSKEEPVDANKVFPSYVEHMKTAVAKRKQAATKMNENSSRSHMIVILKLYQYWPDVEDQYLSSTAYLVDLAGSERQSKKSFAEQYNDEKRDNPNAVRGVTFEEFKTVRQRLEKEGIFINESLTVLRKVVFAISKNRPHIPSNENKLTTVLKDGLNGAASIVVLITLSPTERDEETSISTLRFGNDCKGLKCATEANVEELSEEALKEKQRRDEEIEKEVSRRLRREKRKNTASPFSSPTKSSMNAILKSPPPQTHFVHSNSESAPQLPSTPATTPRSRRVLSIEEIRENNLLSVEDDRIKEGEDIETAFDTEINNILKAREENHEAVKSNMELDNLEMMEELQKIDKDMHLSWHRADIHRIKAVHSANLKKIEREKEEEKDYVLKKNNLRTHNQIPRSDIVRINRLAKQLIDKSESEMKANIKSSQLKYKEKLSVVEKKYKLSVIDVEEENLNKAIRQNQINFDNAKSDLEKDLKSKETKINEDCEVSLTQTLNDFDKNIEVKENIEKIIRVEISIKSKAVREREELTIAFNEKILNAEEARFESNYRAMLDWIELSKEELSKDAISKKVEDAEWKRNKCKEDAKIKREKDDQRAKRKAQEDMENLNESIEKRRVELMVHFCRAEIKAINEAWKEKRAARNKDYQESRKIAKAKYDRALTVISEVTQGVDESDASWRTATERWNFAKYEADITLANELYQIEKEKLEALAPYMMKEEVETNLELNEKNVSEQLEKAQSRKKMRDAVLQADYAKRKKSQIDEKKGEMQTTYNMTYQASKQKIESDKVRKHNDLQTWLNSTKDPWQKISALKFNKNSTLNEIQTTDENNLREMAVKWESIEEEAIKLRYQAEKEKAEKEFEAAAVTAEAKKEYIKEHEFETLMQRANETRQQMLKEAEEKKKALLRQLQEDLEIKKRDWRACLDSENRFAEIAAARNMQGDLELTSDSVRIMCDDGEDSNVQESLVATNNAPDFVEMMPCVATLENSNHIENDSTRIVENNGSIVQLRSERVMIGCSGDETHIDAIIATKDREISSLRESFEAQIKEMIDENNARLRDMNAEMQKKDEELKQKDETINELKEKLKQELALFQSSKHTEFDFSERMKQRHSFYKSLSEYLNSLSHDFLDDQMEKEVLQRLVKNFKGVTESDGFDLNDLPEQLQKVILE